MAKNPNNPKKPVKTPKSKAHRPDVQPIGPALAELLNPAINRGDAGLGSGTGLRPPPDNSKDRRSGGEAAVHRARASTRGTSDDVAKRDAGAAHREAVTKRGSSDEPIRNESTARAHWRPSRIAHTTSDCPRRMSPAAKTLATDVR